MARTQDFKSAFDIIGPKMIGPSSSHTAGAVKIGNALREVLQHEPENLEVHYYESFAATHQGHGTDLAIVGGALGFTTFDERIPESTKIAEKEGIKVDIIEESGHSLGEHPNCALLKADAGDRHVEVNGISIGGGTIKIKSIHVNGLCILMNHGLPILVIDGDSDIASINHLINDLIDKDVDINEEIKTIHKDGCLLALHLNKDMQSDLLEQMRDKYSNLNFSYVH